MRVLFFYSAEQWTGCARAFTSGGRLLAERGYAVTMACRPHSAVEQRMAESELTVATVSGDGTWLDESRRLRRALLEHFVEVVFVHTEREHLIAASALRWAERGAAIRRIPVGAELTVGRAERAAARLAAGGFLFADSRRLHDAAIPSRPISPGLAPPGVSVERHSEIRAVPRSALNVPPAGKLLVCVTDPSSRASVATVLRTVALLAERHPDLRLALVGSGADHEDLRMHAAALGITGIVGFLGEREDQLAIIRAADIGWVVAAHDDAAYGYLDFMATRTPVVTERGPLAQLYVADGITGIHLAPRDAPAAAAAIASLLADEERCAAMGRAAQARAAREFSETVTGDGFEQAAAAARDRTVWRQ